MLAISISHKKDVKLWKVGSPAHGHKARPGAGMELVSGACCPQNPYSFHPVMSSSHCVSEVVLSNYLDQTQSSRYNLYHQPGHTHRCFMQVKDSFMQLKLITDYIT